MRIPDREINHFEKITTNYRQVKLKIDQLEKSVTTSRLPINENEKLILEILKDIRQMLKVMNGIHKDDDV